jgi:two-component system sensor histidine kinase PhoQ
VTGDAMYSLNNRLLTAASLLLLAFFALTVLALDAAFKDTGRRAMVDVLDARIITLLAVAEPGAGHSLLMPPDLPEARLSHPGSGLYARLTDRSGTELWRSPSSVGASIDYGPPPAVGARRTQEAGLANVGSVLAHSFAIEWEFGDGKVFPFVFSVAESMESYYAQIGRFRQQMMGWFLLLWLLMLFALALLLRWGLRPVRRIASEIAEVELGGRHELGTGYPRELEGVRRNMNGLIASQRDRLRRHRDALGDLAHSLKTPLAVLRGQMERPQEQDVPLMSDQVSRMDEIVSYQLKRAAAAGRGGLGEKPVDIGAALTDLKQALEKVYADRSISLAIVIAGDPAFFGDRGDLIEITGNLLDNACKWCRERVRVQALPVSPEASGRNRGLKLVIEDDGPGIAPELEAAILERGGRANKDIEGQGIGLAVVREIIAGYGGGISFSRSRFGGACVTVSLPGGP